jgi:hypothetical protein
MLETGLSQYEARLLRDQPAKVIEHFYISTKAVNGAVSEYNFEVKSINHPKIILSHPLAYEVWRGNKLLNASYGQHVRPYANTMVKFYVDALAQNSTLYGGMMIKGVLVDVKSEEGIDNAHLPRRAPIFYSNRVPIHLNYVHN